MKGVRFGFVLPMFLALCTSSALAGDADRVFAERVAAELKQALPGYEITVSDPLTLRFGPPGQANVQVNLDRVRQYCDANPDDCEREVSDFVAKASAFAKNQLLPMRPEQLRAVVRPENYVDEMVKEIAGKVSGVSLVSAPLAGDLVTLCYFDLPTTMRVATTKDLSAIGLDPAGAMERCKANVKAVLPPLGDALRQTPQGGIFILKGDPYESSYLALHDDWAPIAAKFGGHLIVTAPDADLVLFANEDNPRVLEAVSILAKYSAEHAERVVSTNVFRWTQAGWDVASP